MRYRSRLAGLLAKKGNKHLADVLIERQRDKKKSNFRSPQFEGAIRGGGEGKEGLLDRRAV